MNYKILICEDDVAIQELIDLYLDKTKYETIFASDGEEALFKFRDEKPDLILLDITMPKKNGLEVCKEIRETSYVPIIFVTSHDDSKDVVEGLMAGADDYVSKPFNMQILLARIEANLRYKGISTSTVEKGYTKINQLEINYDKHQVFKNGKEISLHPKELRLLFFLAKNPNKVLRSHKIYEEVWEADSLGDTLTVSVHISRIRSKIEDDPKQPTIIKTVKGAGYMLVNE